MLPHTSVASQSAGNELGEDAVGHGAQNADDRIAPAANVVSRRRVKTPGCAHLDGFVGVAGKERRVVIVAWMMTLKLQAAVAP